MKLLLSDATKLTVSNVVPTATQVNGNTVDAIELTLENMTLEQVRSYFSGGSLLSIIHLYTDNMVLRKVYTGYEVTKSIAVGSKNDGQFVVLLAKTSEVNEIVKALDKAVNEIRTESITMANSVTQHTEEIAVLKSDVLTLTAQVSEMRKSIEDTLQSVVKNAERCTKIENAVSDLNVKITEFTKTITTYANRVADTDARSTELGNQVSEVVQSTKNAMEVADKAALKVSSYDQSISYMNTRVTEVSESNVVLKDKVDTLGTEAEKLSNTVTSNAAKAKEMINLKTDPLSAAVSELTTAQANLSTAVNDNVEKTEDLDARVTAIEPVSDYTVLPLSQAIEYRVKESQEALEAYLASHPITSTCHNKAGALYSITSDKQAYLQAMILTATTALSNGVPFTPSWNATGEECTYDWTIDELNQLALEIATRIRPLVSYQQKLEKKFRSCSTMAQLQAVVIDFDSVVSTSENV